jgi:hypothetical protein
MLAWSTIPYAFWQLSYYFFITVRRREKIAAGRPTSFTWLRKSYSKVWIGKIVLSLPNALQEPAFMLIQYSYAVLTMLPCPLWFYSRWASAIFLLTVFTWSVYNGSTYYIDVFGKRFQKEMEAMKAEVAKWQHSTEGSINSPLLAPQAGGPEGLGIDEKQLGQMVGASILDDGASSVGSSIENIPLLNEERVASATGAEVEDGDGGARDIARERKKVSLDPGM